MTTNLKTKTCPECGEPFALETGKPGKPRVFCSNDCKAAHSNRRTARGKNLAAIAQGWRQTRGSGDLGKFLFAEMTAMLDQWNAEDLAAGRMRAADYAASVCDFTPTNSVQYAKGYTASRFMDRRNGR